MDTTQLAVCYSECQQHCTFTNCLHNALIVTLKVDIYMMYIELQLTIREVILDIKLPFIKHYST